MYFILKGVSRLIKKVTNKRKYRLKHLNLDSPATDDRRSRVILK